MTATLEAAVGVLSLSRIYQSENLRVWYSQQPGLAGQEWLQVKAGIAGPLCPALQEGKASCRHPPSALPAPQERDAGVWVLPPPPPPGRDNAPGSGRFQGRAAAPRALPSPCGGLRHSCALSGNENIPEGIRAALGKRAARQHPQPTKGTERLLGGVTGAAVTPNSSADGAA